MKATGTLLLVFLATTFNCTRIFAQKQAVVNPPDSSQSAEKYLLQQKQAHLVDSLLSAQLQTELLQVNTDANKRKELEDRIKELSVRDSVRKAVQLKKIAELRQQAKAYPVVLLNDTLFNIYTGVGSFSAAERAAAVTARITKLYNDDFFKADSLTLAQNEASYDIVYENDQTLMQVNNLDALWFNQPQDSLARTYITKIKSGILKAKVENSFTNWLIRLGYILLIMLGMGVIIFVINAIFKRTAKFILVKKEKYFNGIAVKNIKIIPAKQHYMLAVQANNLSRIVVMIAAVYLSLPPLFGLFPQTRLFGNLLWNWITTPAKAIFDDAVKFLPNLFTILIICIVFRYLVRVVRFFTRQIEKGDITIHGFHSDWAKPTFNIIRFIIYAFMFVIVFPYLPGSSSPAFQGVSVFLGLLISLGSSSAISNMVSGLVITYMRPFKIGDRVKIGEVTGDVIEKTMLVTRLRTTKNEDITVPNSTVLNSHTVNYSANANARGLIVHTNVTISYNVPWKQMHQALIDAALRTPLILNEPLPFVLQTSLDDFYVSYQLNAFTREANRQSTIYSALHESIQDVCNERGIEIMSPHYNSMRDGSHTTIPENYLPKDYKAPEFKVNLGREKSMHETFE